MKVLSYFLLSAFLFSATSCLNQEGSEYIPGVIGPTINIQNGKILLTVELENVDLDAGITLPIRDMENSTVTVGPALNDDLSSAGTMVQVAFDLNDVDSDYFDVVPHETLPDGRAFPFMIDGTLPALAINVPQAKDMTFYASNTVFGFFLPITLPSSFVTNVYYRIKINGENYGIVSLIHPNENGEGAGVVLLQTLEDIRENSDFKKLIKLSKKNKSVVY